MFLDIILAATPHSIPATSVYVGLARKSVQLQPVSSSSIYSDLAWPLLFRQAWKFFRVCWHPH